MVIDRWEFIQKLQGIYLVDGYRARIGKYECIRLDLCDWCGEWGTSVRVREGCITSTTETKNNDKQCNLYKVKY